MQNMAKMAFTTDEFDTMVNQLLCDDGASFDMLFQIAEKTLRGRVTQWCNTSPELRGKGFEGDILHDTYIRLVQKTVSHFLLRNGVDAPVNRDPKGFKNWMFKVAENIKNDYIAKILKAGNKTCSLEDEPGLAEEADDLSERIEAKRELLSHAFEIVLDHRKVEIYKILTWMAQCVFMLTLDVEKKDSNGMIVQAFEEKTLFEMRDTVFDYIGKISWITITKEQKSRIEQALNALYDEQRRYGEIPYQEFFMKKGGKATISDWVNRINDIVKRGMTNDEALNS